MYDPSGRVLRKAASDAQEFFKKYFAEHGDYEPGKLRNLKKLKRALKEAGFDEGIIFPLASLCDTNFFQPKGPDLK